MTDDLAVIHTLDFFTPIEVLSAMHDFLACAGGNPGRSGHRLSVEIGRIIHDAREAVAELFNSSPLAPPDPLSPGRVSPRTGQAPQPFLQITNILVIACQILAYFTSLLIDKLHI